MDGRASAYNRVTRVGVGVHEELPEISSSPHLTTHGSVKHQKRTVSSTQWRGKRALDFIGACVLAILFSPLIIAVSAWLFFNGRPILFGHTRIGRGGKPFICYKFRTMVPNAERMLQELFEREPKMRAEWTQKQKLKNDPRITRVGCSLRKTSLDELPQLWNVIKGEMSLVGPRPIAQDEMFRYGRAIRHYLAIKPGITGLWQVSGRNNVGYCRRVALDRAYALRSSLNVDLWILLRTVSVTITRSGAY